MPVPGPTPATSAKGLEDIVVWSLLCAVEGLDVEDVGSSRWELSCRRRDPARAELVVDGGQYLKRHELLDKPHKVGIEGIGCQK